MRGLKEKVVVITGAAGGIGKSLVRRFCEEGAFVVAVDVNADALDTLGRELDAHAANISPVQLDITDHEAVVKAMTEVATQRGGIDVLVNNAGWDVAMQFLETDPAFWQKVIAINLLGPLNLHHAILPLMTNRKQGKIINISSDAGRVGSSGESVYSADVVFPHNLV